MNTHQTCYSNKGQWSEEIRSAKKMRDEVYDGVCSGMLEWGA
jgi:hypothetical protein